MDGNIQAQLAIRTQIVQAARANVPAAHTYCTVVPGSVRWPFEYHLQYTRPQQANHGQQADVLPQVLIYHWRAPL